MLPPETPNRPLTRWDGLTEFLGRPLEEFPRESRDAYRSMSKTDRNRYDERRLLHMNTGFVIQTPEVGRIIETVQDLLYENAGLSSGHAGLHVSGPGTLGKTTAALIAMRTVHLQEVRRHPGWLADGRVPVAYVLIPSESGAVALATRIAEFYGLTVRSKETLNSLTTRICATIAKARTKLIVIDELQHLSPRDRFGRQSLSFLKDLHNQAAGVTFLYLSAEITPGEAFSGDFATQIRGRVQTHRVERYRYTTPTEKELWKELISAVERELPLFDHKVGSLRRHAQELHRHSGGSIGDLVRLMRMAATRQIRQRGAEAPETIRIEDVLALQPSMAAVDLMKRVTAVS